MKRDLERIPTQPIPGTSAQRNGLSSRIGARFQGQELSSEIEQAAPAGQKARKRKLGAGRGSVTFLSDDWNKPMSDEEADAFWVGSW